LEKTPRGATLKNAMRDDILLFWGVLYHNEGRTWASFTGEKGWYLVGSLRIEAKISTDSDLDALSNDVRMRALSNVHFRTGKRLPQNDYVFVGDRTQSGLFHTAVDLGVRDSIGLIYRAFTAANGQPLRCGQRPRWYSSLRSCRRILDMSQAADQERTRILRIAIERAAGLDVFASVLP